jgi:cytidylate kinase
MTGKIIIAVDGPSASGKGTIARGLARHFGFAHLDTGLLYRAVGRIAFEQDPSMEQKFIAIRVAQNLTVDKLDNPLLRNDESSMLASKVAVIPEVREALLDYQRHFAIYPPADGAVLDGRDIGTVICPLAPVKLFVTASAEIRAKRRHSELESLSGQKIDFQTVLSDIISRDNRDINRKTAPLKPAPDSVLLDTTEMSVDNAIAKAIALTENVMNTQDRKLFVCV